MIDNLRMAARAVPGGRAERRAAVERAQELFPVLAERRSQHAGSLSGGQQQMLALGRALATSPKLIIADEMSLGLAPLVVDAVFEQLARARELGVAVLLIEQFAHRALAMADRSVIFSRGSVSWAGPAARAGAAVLDRYLGTAATAAATAAEGA